MVGITPHRPPTSKGENNMKKTYLINGWEESKSYFFSFGFTQKEIERMENGEQIRRTDSVSDNTFAIRVDTRDI